MDSVRRLWDTYLFGHRTLQRREFHLTFENRVRGFLLTDVHRAMIYRTAIEAPMNVTSGYSAGFEGLIRRNFPPRHDFVELAYEDGRWVRYRCSRFRFNSKTESPPPEARSAFTYIQEIQTRRSYYYLRNGPGEPYDEHFRLLGSIVAPETLRRRIEYEPQQGHSKLMELVLYDAIDNEVRKQVASLSARLFAEYDGAMAVAEALSQGFTEEHMAPWMPLFAPIFDRYKMLIGATYRPGAEPRFFFVGRIAAFDAA